MTADELVAWIERYRYTDGSPYSVEDMGMFRTLVGEIHRLRQLVNETRASDMARMREECAVLRVENLELRQRLDRTEEVP